MVGFERRFTKVERLQYSTLSRIYKQDGEYYTRIPEVIMEELKLEGEKTVLWKRFKFLATYRINVCIDKPRFYKHKRSGLAIESTKLVDGVTKVPRKFVECSKLNKYTLLQWKINRLEKRYYYATLLFNKYN